jgi:hypothetical protein
VKAQLVLHDATCYLAGLADEMDRRVIAATSPRRVK